MTKAEDDTTPPEPPDRDPAAESSSSDEKLKRLRARPPHTEERYKLDGEIGRGGMGAVLRVRDCDLERDLAMKVVLGAGNAPSGKTPPVDPELLQRFLAEAQITGQLDHPGVVPVHEIGVDPTGRVYFTMRLVKGDTADVAFASAREGKNGWTQTRALEVILKVCDTMAFAHKKGVLHRDLKPSNVMVGRFGEVYVMDWGLAKVHGKPDSRDMRVRPESTVSNVRTDRSKDEEASDSPLLTMDGAKIGTPSYMSPEQAEGRIELIDHRTDVYAIGAMLYRLLTGREPYVNPGAHMNQWAIVAAVAAGPPVAINKIDRTVSPVLVAVCEKAMARERTHRYQDVLALADDLRAYLDKRVVKAYRSGAVAELTMWVRRNQVLALAAVALVGALVLGVTGTAIYAGKAQALASEQKGQLVRASAAAFQQADRLLAQFHNHEEGLLQLARAIELDPSNKDAWTRLASEVIMRPGEFRPLAPIVMQHDGWVRDGAFSPDGKRIATASDDGTARLWDAHTGTLLRRWAHPLAVTKVAFAPDSLHVATACDDGRVRIWKTDEDTVTSNLQHPGPVHLLQFSPDGAYLAVAIQGAAWVWDVSRATCRVRLVHEPTREAVSADERIVTIAFDSSSTRLLTCAQSLGVSLWDISGPSETLLCRYPRHDDEGVQTYCAFANHEANVVTTSLQGWISVYDTASGKTIAERYEHTHRPIEACVSPDAAMIITATPIGAEICSLTSTNNISWLNYAEEVRHVAFSPSGQMALTTTDSCSRLWSSSTRGLMHTYKHGAAITSAVFAPDESAVLTTACDSTAVLWETGSGRPGVSLHHERIYHGSVVQAHDGRTIITSSEDAPRYGTTVWSMDTGQRVAQLHDERSIHDIRSVDGGVVMVCGSNVVRWNGESQRVMLRLDADRLASWAELSSSGRLLLTGCKAGFARLWSLHEPRLLGTFRHSWVDPATASLVADATSLSTAISPDERLVATTGMGLPTKVWSVASGTLLRELGAGQFASFSPDSNTVLVRRNDAFRAVRGEFGLVQIWDLHSGAKLWEADNIGVAEFSADGSRLALSRDQGGIDVRDVRSGRSIILVGSADLDCSNGRFSPDGKYVATSGVGSSARVWSAESGNILFEVQGLRGVRDAWFSFDGTRLVTRDQDERVGVWSFALPLTMARSALVEDVDHIRTVAELLTGRRITAKGNIESSSFSDEQKTTAHVLATCPRLAPLISWLTARGENAPAYLGAPISRRQRADMLLEMGGLHDMKEAYMLCPSHPLVHIALAAHASDGAFSAGEVASSGQRDLAAAAKARSEFLRDYGLRRLPNDATICARAGRILLAQGDKVRAQLALEKALRLEPNNVDAKGLLDALNK